MHLVKQDGHVSLGDRQRLMRQCPLTVWLTGLSGAGKSTLGFLLEKALFERGRKVFVLDGDNVRHGLNRDLTFTPKDRSENIRRIAEVARLMNDAGLVVVTAFISPFREDREMARDIIGTDRFLEVFVSTPLDVCEARDPKQLYVKARAGQIKDFTGISSPYEAPYSPDLELNTSLLNQDECLSELLSTVVAKIEYREGI